MNKFVINILCTLFICLIGIHTVSISWKHVFRIVGHSVIKFYYIPLKSFPEKV